MSAANNIYTCVLLNIIFGQNHAGVPIWCDDDARTAIIAAACAGHHISPLAPPPDLLEGNHAANDLLRRLVSDGLVPAAFKGIEALSREQYVEQGYEDSSDDIPASMQIVGIPEFTTLDIARLLYFLRRAAHCAQLWTGAKRVFQLGILTTTLEGGDTHVAAQVYPWGLEGATDTVWLYRYCVSRGNGQYEEHWRPFATLPGKPIAVPVEDIAANLAVADQAPAPTTQTYAPQDQTTGLLSPPGTHLSNHMSAQDYAAFDYEAPDPPSPTPGPRLNNPTNASNTTNASGTPNPTGVALTFKNYDTIHLTTAELMASDPILLQGQPLLKLAQVYSNSQLYANINALRPGAMASPNVITKRLTKAIAEEAKASRSTEVQVREWLKERREASGVSNKMKTETRVYADRARRGLQVQAQAQAPS